jgi:O-antigen/teichoic acid export membrane protein
MLVTIPSYLWLSDVGLSAAAATDVTKAVAAGNYEQALSSFQTSRLFATIMTAGIAMLSVIGLVVWLHSFTPVSGPWDAEALSWAVVFTTLGTLCSLQMGIFQIIYQATNKYAFGTAIRDLNIPFQGFAVIAVAYLGGDLADASAVSAGIAGLMLIVYAAVLVRVEPWVKLNFTYANWATLRRLLRPSMASFALAGANSIGLQAVVVTIGWALGPAAAAIFATARMISRTPLQFAGLLSRASLPELTKAIEVGNTSLTARLMRLNIWAATVVMAPAMLILLLWGPNLLLFLSGGALHANRTLFTLLGFAALFNAIWTTLAMKLLAQNRHGEYAWLVLGLNILVALVPLLTGSGLFAAAAVMMVSDGIILILVLAKSRDILR